MQLHGYTCILNRKLNNINLNAKQDNFNFCLQLFDTIVYSNIFLNCDFLYYVFMHYETETKTYLSTKNFTFNFTTYIVCWIDWHCFWLVILFIDKNKDTILILLEMKKNKQTNYMLNLFVRLHCVNTIYYTK